MHPLLASPKRGPRAPSCAPPSSPGLWLCALACLAAGAAGASETTMKTRPSALAGSWYAADARELARSVDEHLAQGEPLEEIARSRPLALIAPHAGHRWSGDGAGRAFRLLAGEAGRGIERVLLIGPSHYQSFRGAVVTEAGAYATPLGDVPVDTGLARALLGEPHFHALPSAERREHCLEIQLPFLQRVLRHPFRIVPILVSQATQEDWREIAIALARHLDEQTLVVVSSDFTHYGPRFGYTPFDTDEDANLRRLDRGALEPILDLDAGGFAAYKARTDISVCGAHPIGILIEVLLRPELQARWGGAPAGRVLDYYRSADLLGDFEDSVSYAAVAFFRPGDLLPGPVWPPLLAGLEPPVSPTGETRAEAPAARPAAAPSAAPSGAPSRAGETAPSGPAEASPGAATDVSAELLNEAERRFLLDLARRTLLETTAGRPAPRAADFPAGVSAEKMLAPTGVFVTLHERGALRGCIGHIFPQEPLAQAVISNAVSAAFHDPRFAPVTAEEIPRLHLEISVLTPPRAVSGPEAIVVGRHGVLLERGGRRAVFLPQVAPEQGWDRETMLGHLAVKAGLPRDAWRQGASFQVFEAFVFEED